MPRPPHALLTVRRFLEARGITGQPVLVAVSGGADSVALLRLLSQLRDPLGLQLIAAHFDHALRHDSARDAEWVSALTDRLDIPCVTARAIETPPGTGIEAWARRQRYTYLRGLAQSQGANWVAVAHTADDQAETVLHHIVRGTGLAGLAGMPAVRRLDGHRSAFQALRATPPLPSPARQCSTFDDVAAGEGGRRPDEGNSNRPPDASKCTPQSAQMTPQRALLPQNDAPPQTMSPREKVADRPDEGDSTRPQRTNPLLKHTHNNPIRLIRPCLDIRRSDLRNYLATVHQDFLNDPTNNDPRWTRNEIRGELIPRLEERFNPKVVEALLSLSRQAADAARVMRRQAAKLLKRAIVEATPECVRLKTGPFAKADAAVVREAAVRLWRIQGWPRQRMSFRHWAAAAELLRGAGPAGVEWPGGMSGARRGGLVVIERRLL